MTARKRISLLLSLALIFSAVLTAEPVAAVSEDGGAPEISLDAGVIGKKDTVWFGSHNNSAVEWRVLSGSGDTDPGETLIVDGKETTLPVSQKGELLLISREIMDASVYFKQDGTSNQWAGSDAQGWCKALYTNWPIGPEKEAIKATAVNEQNSESGGIQYFYYGGYFGEYYSAAPLQGEHFFFLSAREADKLFEDDADRVAGSWWWWLRSPWTPYDNEAGYVDDGGWVVIGIVDNGSGARPAFNLNLPSVLFVSAAEGGKSIAAESGESSGAEGAGLYEIPSGSKTEWKLTLIDTSRSGFKYGGDEFKPVIGAPGATVSIPYAEAQTAGNNEYVSILLCQGEGGNQQAKYYGSYKIKDASGAALFALPSDLPPGKYDVKLFNEQRNENHKSDYSSNFVEITLEVKKAVEHTVTFKVVNGAWDSGDTADIPVTLTGYEGDTLKLAASQIPAVGGKPKANYQAGAWDVAPSTETKITGPVTYTYTYVPKNPVSQTVTFKVVNGAWDSGDTADIPVTLTGYEGDILKLAASQIPAVGSKPAEGFKGGSWDSEPGTETAITGPATYTYVYAPKATPSVTPPGAIQGLYFTGEYQALVTPGSASGGEMLYALGESGESAPKSGWSSEPPTGRESGTYYVWYKVTGYGENADTAPACVPVAIDAAHYSVLEGAEGVWRRGGAEGLEFTVKRSAGDEWTYRNFRRLTLDGADLKEGDTEVREGSLKATLKAAKLETLALGRHVIKFVFTDGETEAAFTVKPAEGSFEDVAIPSDTFTFKKVWEGGSEKSIDFTLYKLGDTVYRHGFDKKIISETEWRYNAWFSEAAACYVIEEPVEGYKTRYENVGVYANITDRCCDGGTIVNYKVPKTGDSASLQLWAGMVLMGLAITWGAAAQGKRKRAIKG